MTSTATTQKKYDEFLSRWQGCTACSLYKSRNKMVFWRGKIPCDLLLVGEAPGVSENLFGLPFVGEAGKHLDDLIKIALKDLSPVRICFTNLVCCFPKEQKKTDNHQPPEEAIVACHSRLAEFIEIANPKGLVCVGELASDWIRRYGLDYEDIALFDIVHPAAILRAHNSMQQSSMSESCASGIRKAAKWVLENASSS